MAASPVPSFARYLLILQVRDTLSLSLTANILYAGHVPPNDTLENCQPDAQSEKISSGFADTWIDTAEPPGGWRIRHALECDKH